MQSIFGKIDLLYSQQLRELNIDQYINKNISIEIQKFHEKVNSLFPSIKNISQTKDLYISKTELIKNFIKTNTQEKLKSKIQSCLPWPKNITELLKEQNINKLSPGATKYELYLNKKSYEIIARNDGKKSLPNIKSTEKYRIKELPFWRNSKRLLYNDFYSEAIDNWFEPDAQFLILSKNNVSQRNWRERGHIPFFSIFRGGKPPRPQQQSKVSISIHIDKPLNIKNFVKSGSDSIPLSNNNSDILVSGTGGSVQNIKLELK